MFPCREKEYLSTYRRKHYAENRDQIRAYMREWHKQHKGKRQAYDAKWRAANPEVALASNRKKANKYYAGHPEYRARAVLRAKQWSEQNPDRDYINRRKAWQTRRARQAGSYIGPIDYNKIMLDAQGLCGICHSFLGDSPIHFDHIIPIARGGTHTQDNIQVSHPSCNHRKGMKLPEELIQVA